MATANVTWVGELPPPPISDALRQLMQEVTWADAGEFNVIAQYEPNGPESEKVIMCREKVFLCIWRRGILALLPDRALHVPKLIDIWGHERMSLNVLSWPNIINAMSE